MRKGNTINFKSVEFLFQVFDFSASLQWYFNWWFFSFFVVDRRQAEESQTFIADLETIDDDLSARGVNMVKISDMETAEDYGIEDLPAVVYFENGIPFVYMGK